MAPRPNDMKVHRARISLSHIVTWFDDPKEKNRQDMFLPVFSLYLRCTNRFLTYTPLIPPSCAYAHFIPTFYWQLLQSL